MTLSYFPTVFVAEASSALGRQALLPQPMRAPGQLAAGSQLERTVVVEALQMQE